MTTILMYGINSFSFFCFDGSFPGKHRLLSSVCYFCAVKTLVKMGRLSGANIVKFQVF